MDFLLQPVSFCRSLSGFRAKLSRLPTNYARRRPSDVTDTKTCVCAGGREHARTENGACGVLWAREREEIREISRRVTNRARTVNVIGHGYLPATLVADLVEELVSCLADAFHSLDVQYRQIRMGDVPAFRGDLVFGDPVLDFRAVNARSGAQPGGPSWRERGDHGQLRDRALTDAGPTSAFHP